MKKATELIPIMRPSLPEMSAFIRYAGTIWENHYLSNGGPLVRKLEERLCERLRVPYMTVFCNGHMALDGVLRVMELGEGEVITTPFTYISTGNAIAMNGLKPVFCDIKPADCTIDENKIEALITEKTKAIIPVHVYGFPCNHAAIKRIAKKYGLKLIYDAAHAFGVTVDDTGIGTWGDASMFSFHATKVYHTVEGGCVTYSDEALRSKLVAVKNFGMVGKEDALRVGYNAKLTEMHAAMGLANLDCLEPQFEERGALVRHYLARLSGIAGIRTFSWDAPNVCYNYAYFPVCFETVGGLSRDVIAGRLLEEYNIQVRKYFYPALNDISCYRDMRCGGRTPIAKDIASRVVTLPLYAGLAHNQVDYICDALAEILRGQ